MVMKVERRCLGLIDQDRFREIKARTWYFNENWPGGPKVVMAKIPAEELQDLINAAFSSVLTEDMVTSVLHYACGFFHIYNNKYGQEPTKVTDDDLKECAKYFVEQFNRDSD